jgi:hypothetical protein
VGPACAAHGLISQFLMRCDRVGLRPVFYEASSERLGDFADHGMTAVKIGEEARVPLASFSLGGSAFKALRSSINKMTREGYTFRVVEASSVPALITELRDVSDEWLDAKSASEKGFSLGYFKPEYLERFPMALIERNGRIDAFANLWTSAERGEVSPDLMRQRSDAPSGTMDALFAHLMLWVVQPGHGAAIGAPAIARRPRLDARRPFRIQAWRGLLQLPGPACVQGEIQPRLGTTVSRLPRRADARTCACRRRSTRCRRIGTDLHARWPPRSVRLWLLFR